MRSLVRTLVLLSLPALPLACSDVPTDPAEPIAPTPPSAAATGSGFPMYGLGGLTRATPGEPCSAAPYDQFDFWLGEWEVFNPAGTLIGTNSVSVELDGCVVAEDWTSAGGNRGRSINTWDAETGQWHQTWVSAFFAGHLRMAGGLTEDGRMVLKGQRQIAPGITILDEYRWTPLAPDRVLQFGQLEVPALDILATFEGIYELRDEIVPAPEVPTTGCQVGGQTPESRQLDFWLGDWVVTARNGKVLGTSTVSADLSGCLIEERFRTPKGYEAVSFAAFDFYEKRWYRTYIDNRGERLELSGTRQGAGVVLSGQEAGPGASGPVLQRVTVAPTDDGRVRQTLEVSRDDGASWGPSLDLLYEPAG